MPFSLRLAVPLSISNVDSLAVKDVPHEVRCRFGKADQSLPIPAAIKVGFRDLAAEARQLRLVQRDIQWAEPNFGVWAGLTHVLSPALTQRMMGEHRCCGARR